MGHATFAAVLVHPVCIACMAALLITCCVFLVLRRKGAWTAARTAACLVLAVCLAYFGFLISLAAAFGGNGPEREPSPMPAVSAGLWQL